MKKLLILAALGFTLSANAQFVDGNKLLEFLDGTPTDSLLGMGYIAGVYDSQRDISYCTPAGVTLGQVKDMTILSLRANPATRNEPANFLIVRMLGRYWPCEKKGSGV